jgi:hypothetical protein
MPKFLFDGEMKSELSNDAKVLYSLLRNRHELSLANGWVNKNNEVYIIFSRVDMCEMLGKSSKTVGKFMKELAEFKLIEEERQGLNKPNLIFLSYIDTSATPKNDPQSTDTQGSVNLTHQDRENLHIKKCENSTSRDVKFTPEYKQTNNKTDIKNNNFNNPRAKNNFFNYSAGSNVDYNAVALRKANRGGNLE